MQRVAVELAQALEAHPQVTVSKLVLHSSWRWLHLRSGPWLAWTAARIYRAARQRSCDIVLFSSMVTGALAVLIGRHCRIRGIPTVAIAHGRDVTLPGLYQHVLVRRTLRALDAVLPVSRATGQACAQRGMPADRIFVVPNGVNLARFPLGTGSGHPLSLMSVGRLVARKGFAWFVDAVMPLLPADTRYCIAGHGDEAHTIGAAIRRHGLEDRVQLLGRCSDEELVRWYTQADLLVMPNLPVAGDMEGFGVVMLEAGACGTPVIAAALEGIRDVVTPGENGWLVRSGDADAYARAITEAPKDERTRERVHAHTAKRFGWDRVSTLYVRQLANVKVR